MRNPIVLDPPNFDCAAAWGECAEYVARNGGIMDQDGEVNWRAAAGADPGVTHCPACHDSLWQWGRRVRCPQCGFEFPMDWWLMYDAGVAEARRQPLPHWPADEAARMQRYYEEQHRERSGHPYYDYGYRHPVADAWAEQARIDWRQVLSGCEHSKVGAQ